MRGEHDGELSDLALQDEIALLGEVIADAAHASQHLTDAEVDEILGVKPSGPKPPYGAN